MKILFPIGTLFPSQNGGPSNTVYWMAKALTKNGIEVTCITTSLGINISEIPLDKWLDTDYGKVIYTKDGMHNFPFKMLFHSYRKMKSIDVIHLTSLFYLPSIILALTAFIFRKKTVWSIRGTLEDSALKISPIKKIIVLFLIKRIKHRVIFHSTSNQETKNIIHHFGKYASAIEIPNFMELPKLIQKRDSQKKSLLYLGRLHPIKAIDRLIHALAKSKIFMSNTDSELVIAGEGTIEYTNYLKTLLDTNELNNKVQFFGQVEGLAKEELVANSFFCILPSHSENFGNVVLESLSQGTPVLASKGSPWQSLEDNNCGFWVENDVESLTVTLDRILEMDSTLYEEYRMNALNLSKKFDIEFGIQNWIREFEYMISNQN